MNHDYAPSSATKFPRAIAAGGSVWLLACFAATACRSEAHAVPDRRAAIAAAVEAAAASGREKDAAHGALFANARFPSAAECGECHPKQFYEWSTSPHAYAQLSPVFNAMQGAITAETAGTNGDFCIRCHTPVGMELGEPVFTTNLERDRVSVEGITCVVCHRVNGDYGKISGRFRVESGDLHAPVYGPSDDTELRRVLADKDWYGPLAARPDDPGSVEVHGEIETAFFLTQPGFCGSCHDVTGPNGFRLEEAFSEYKSSPAASQGTSCQDCHMSVTEGADGGYADGPAATIAGRATRNRKLTSHYFAGPDYSIVHKGIYPVLGSDDAKLATMAQWLEFDERWGSPEFENAVPAGTSFPESWREPLRRRQAHEILQRQEAKLASYRERQLAVLRAGYQLGAVEVGSTGSDGIDFRVEVKSGTDGHNIPTGFIAERTLFLEVVVEDADGKAVFASGDTDPNGDVRDLHSIYVHNGALPLDPYLFSLQSKFIVRLVRGGEREQVLAVNFSADPLPYIRPDPSPVIATGRTGGARTHRVGLPPKGSRWADYAVKGDKLTGKGPYTAHVRMIAGMVPPNLIEEIKDVGFDYGMNARQIADRVVAGRPILWVGEFPLSSMGRVAVQWRRPELEQGAAGR
ncbi:MAG TPA: multiheme c-type cytochrome [Planctomycetota bacterium]|nr:multiheme c-type cytochrome [Planctomycetota bacterium]